MTTGSGGGGGDKTTYLISVRKGVKLGLTSTNTQVMQRRNLGLKCRPKNQRSGRLILAVRRAIQGFYIVCFERTFAIKLRQKL